MEKHMPPPSEKIRFMIDEAQIYFRTCKNPIVLFMSEMTP